MKFIHEYTLPVEDDVLLRLPAGTKLLSVQVQHGQPQLWALVEEWNDPVDVHLAILGTGHPAERVEGWDFVDTFQLAGGQLVFHVFAKP